MKKIKIVLSLCFIITLSESSAQLIDSASTVTPRLNSDLLFQKARNQKTAAWIFVGAGVGLVIVAGAIGERVVTSIGTDPVNKINSGLQTGGVLALAGGASILTSIPFFIASGKNGRKARVTLNNESNSLLRQLHHKGNIMSVGISLSL